MREPITPIAHVYTPLTRAFAKRHKLRRLRGEGGGEEAFLISRSPTDDFHPISTFACSSGSWQVNTCTRVYTFCNETAPRRDVARRNVVHPRGEARRATFQNISPARVLIMPTICLNSLSRARVAFSTTRSLEFRAPRNPRSILAIRALSRDHARSTRVAFKRGENEKESEKYTTTRLVVA